MLIDVAGRSAYACNRGRRLDAGRPLVVLVDGGQHGDGVCALRSRHPAHHARRAPPRRVPSFRMRMYARIGSVCRRSTIPLTVAQRRSDGDAMLITVAGRSAYAYTGGKRLDAARPLVVLLDGDQHGRGVRPLCPAHHGPGAGARGRVEAAEDATPIDVAGSRAYAYTGGERLDAGRPLVVLVNGTGTATTPPRCDRAAPRITAVARGLGAAAKRR